MKLLEEATSASPPRPSGKRVWATMSATLLVVVIATYVGFSMLTADGDERDENTPVKMDSWVAEASSTCFRVAEEHPILSKGAEARQDASNVAAVAAGVDALDAGVRDLPPLADTDDQERVASVVALGEPAKTAWQQLDGDGEVTDGALSEASELTGTFVAGLVDLGADCGVFN